MVESKAKCQHVPVPQRSVQELPTVHYKLISALNLSPNPLKLLNAAVSNSCSLQPTYVRQQFPYTYFETVSLNTFLSNEVTESFLDQITAYNL